jgi:hypothetical protein
MRKEFNLRDLNKLSKRLNQDPTLIEKDWRQPFYEMFEMNEDQKKTLDELEVSDNGNANLQIQNAFLEAANVARNGGQFKLRVYNDLDLDRRVLRLEFKKFSSDETLKKETVEMSGVDTSLALVCCCAHCGCWHWCGTRPNPCASSSCQ